MPDPRASAQATAPTRRLLLDLLKRRGPSRARQLALSLAVTPTAVRQQLVELARVGQVRGLAGPKRGRGRPAHLWELADAAEAQFPDGHAALCVALADALRASLSPPVLRRILRACVRAQVRAYRERLSTRAGLGPRLRALTAARDAEGYMVELRRVPAGGYLLVQNHCPVCRAARALPELCAAEREALRQALGRVSVTLVEHRLDGARRCVLRIEPQRHVINRPPAVR